MYRPVVGLWSRSVWNFPFSILEVPVGAIFPTDSVGSKVIVPSSTIFPPCVTVPETRWRGKRSLPHPTTATETTTNVQYGQRRGRQVEERMRESSWIGAVTNRGCPRWLLAE
jgi:hypothetical protein